MFQDETAIGQFARYAIIFWIRTHNANTWPEQMQAVDHCLCGDRGKSMLKINANTR